MFKKYYIPKIGESLRANGFILEDLVEYYDIPPKNAGAILNGCFQSFEYLEVAAEMLNLDINDYIDENCPWNLYEYKGKKYTLTGLSKNWRISAFLLNKGLKQGRTIDDILGNKKVYVTEKKEPTMSKKMRQELDAMAYKSYLDIYGRQRR